MLTEKNFIPYGRHHISEEDIQSVVKTLKVLISLRAVEIEFEENISKKVLSKYSICVNSANALHLACLNVRSLKRRYCMDNSNIFCRICKLRLYCGAKIDFVDINPLSGLVDVDNQLKLKMLSIKINFQRFYSSPLSRTSCDMERI